MCCSNECASVISVYSSRAGPKERDAGWRAPVACAAQIGVDEASAGQPAGFQGAVDLGDGQFVDRSRPRRAALGGRGAVENVAAITTVAQAMAVGRATWADLTVGVTDC